MALFLLPQVKQLDAIPDSISGSRTFPIIKVTLGSLAGGTRVLYAFYCTFYLHPKPEQV